MKEELGIAIASRHLQLLFSWPPVKRKAYIFQTALYGDAPLKQHEGAAMAWFSRKEILAQKNVVPQLKWLMRILPLL